MELIVVTNFVSMFQAFAEIVGAPVVVEEIVAQVAELIAIWAQ